MIGLDFPIKPQWIHDVHHLWQPNQPVSELVDHALTSTMQELGGEKTRRNTLSIILRNHVTIEGGGKSRRTAAQDLWVAYSLKYAATTLAPAYLMQLISANQVAQEAVRFINRRYVPGDLIKSEELKRHIIGQYGERKVVTNTVSAFLRTLQHFGVLEPGKQGEYFVRNRLSLVPEVFPLVFMALWQKEPVPQIDVEAFNQTIADAFISTDNIDACWLRYQPGLWVISERQGYRFATVKFPEAVGLTKELLR
jgi:hypothetical protein